MTMNGVMAVILRYFTEFGSFRAHCVKVVEDIPKHSAPEMQPGVSSFQRQAYITYDDIVQGTAPAGGLNTRGVAKYSDFGPIDGYISELNGARQEVSYY